MTVRTWIVGPGPLPEDRLRPQVAGGLRTWQFATALRRAGDPAGVLVVADEPPAHHDDSGFPVEWMSDLDANDASKLKLKIGSLRPDALIGVTAYGSYLAARSCHPVPIWADLSGDPVAEAQAHACARGDTTPVHDALWMLHWCLRRAALFSVVSKAQRLALLGQLGAAGRLTPDAADTEIVEVVPEALPEIHPRTLESSSDSGDRFDVLISGSFNSWVDGPTLLEAVTIAMQAVPALHLVATGGPLAGFLENPWAEFVERISALPKAIRSRFDLRGWVSPAELARIEDSAGCGVAPERPLAERELGGQNRTLRWIAREIPVVTTELTELGKQLGEAGAALVYPAGVASELAERLVRLARDPDLARRLIRRASDWALRTRSVARTTAPLVARVADLRSAPPWPSATADALARRLPQMLLDQLRLEDDLRAEKP